ncbi:MAG: 2-dehydro-3-deoxyphosphooctonate aldolase (KDO 8-P synthase) [Kiritimatiellia bacterium]|jgi:2-dehydro-3-deoxyphosphooctonate aldolase (KDO 8-P synthase)
MKTRSFKIKDIQVGGKHPLFFISGPCVIESRRGCLNLAARLAALASELSVPLIFKASYDKANRTSLDAFRGPGIDEGLDILAEVRETYGLPVISDVHSVEEAQQAGKVLDVLQIPAFLCRQTDLILASGETGKAISVKKGQFLAPWDMPPVIEKLESTGNRRLLLTERGTTFGYNNLVADMRSLVWMGETGYPVVFDATHSVQRPGGAGGHTTGDGYLAPYLARAATATGCHGLFMETHLNPAKALSDKANAIPFNKLKPLWEKLIAIHEVVSQKV